MNYSRRNYHHIKSPRIDITHPSSMPLLLLSMPPPLHGLAFAGGVNRLSGWSEKSNALYELFCAKTSLGPIDVPEAQLPKYRIW